MKRQKRGELIVTDILKFIGENPGRSGLADTPARVTKSWGELFDGYGQNPEEILSRRFDGEDYDSMILLDNIEFHSFCEHHLLPFIGRATVGYIPSRHGGVVGISKLARLVHCYAHRLQIQEKMTHDIAGAINEALSPLGVGVIITAQHFCMKLRGVKEQNSKMTTSTLLGVFREQSVKEEFLRLTKH